MVFGNIIYRNNAFFQNFIASKQIFFINPPFLLNKYTFHPKNEIVAINL